MNKAAEFGADFQEDLPGVFSKSLSTKVVLITSAKDKQTKGKVNKDKYNTDLFLSHVFLFLNSNQTELDQVYLFQLYYFRNKGM